MTNSLEARPSFWGGRLARLRQASGSRKALILCVIPVALAAGPVLAAETPALAGLWRISRDNSAQSCRIMLNPQRSDAGDFFAAVPFACKHAMPLLAAAGRWSMTDDTHLALSAPDGSAVLDLTRDGERFSGQGSDGETYRLVSIRPARLGRSGIDPAAETGKPAIIELAGQPAQAAGLPKAGPSVNVADMPGRYAILRDQSHDTGCMLTLDREPGGKSGSRALLAPACRDQGIVIFDPVGWQIVKGRLVLTAKAGHMTHLDKQADGTWMKDPGEGKSLSLKKL